MIGALDLKLDNHTGFLVLVDDVWNATQKIQRNIGGISETQQIMKGEKIKVEKIFKGNLDFFPSPLPSVKIQIMDEKVCLRCKGKKLLGIVNKLFVIKSLLTTPGNVLPLHLSCP